MFEYQARPAAPVSAAVITVQIFPDQYVSANPVVIPVPGSGRLEQKRFKIRASGIATTAGATTTFGVTLYAGQSLTAASNTALGSLTGVVINTTTAAWFLEGILIFDSVSGHLNGTLSGLINNTIAAAAAITPLSGLNGSSGPLGTEPVVNLCVGCTFGVNASASNVGRMSEFILER
jgi:hypothetical protein